MTRAAVGLLALAAGAAGVGAAAPGAARWLVVTRPIQRCDMMVVPSGGARERLSTAVDLMTGGACETILFTGEQPAEEVDGIVRFLAELEEGRRLHAPEKARDTFGDAEVALRVARENGFRSVLVVTSPYHTRRADWIFSRCFAGTGIELGIHPSAAFYMDYDRWWEGRHGPRAVLGEYARLALCGLASEAIVAGAGSAASPS